MQNENSFCMQQLIATIKGAELPDAGVPKWRPSWLIWGEADVRTVAEAVAEMVAGGRGSKRRRRKREGLKRGERHRRWLLVVGGWLCWLPVVELMMEKLVVSLVGGWNG
jgi:hypothetical protein